MIKIPATRAGILAARTLENPPASASPIHTNATLIFGLVQALACAQGGISVLSPFIGRVKDWWALHDAKLHDPLAEHDPLPPRPLEKHPGVLLVRQIQDAYTTYGHKTEIMAAGFRNVDEIVELGRGGNRHGPNIVTLPPDLLDALRRRQGFEVADVKDLNVPSIPQEEPLYFQNSASTDGLVELLGKYEEDLATEMIVLDKVPEGLDKFSIDAEILEDTVRARIAGALKRHHDG